MRVVTRAAERRFLELELETVALPSARSTFDRLRDDFRTDAVAGENCDFHLMRECKE